MGAEVTLVFPANHPDSIRYLESALERGEQIVAASSEPNANIDSDFADLIELPFVNDPQFKQAFDKLMKTHNISKVYTPTIAVFIWFKEQIKEHCLQLQLIGASPISREVERVRKIFQTVSRYESFIAYCSDNKNTLSRLELAAAFRMSGQIFGESNNDKIAAILAIFATAPKGDVIEVGALVGKSAAVLNAMAKKYAIGSVLVVDPWQAVASAQLDSSPTLRVDVEGAWEQELPQSFLLNLLPLTNGQFNYLRMPSQQGWHLYANQRHFASTEFGLVRYEGQISVIHIDGNHDYLSAKNDCEAWVPLIKPGGWLILDDYVWSHGDGPRRVGDNWLSSGKRSIKRAFVCGKALFIQFEE